MRTKQDISKSTLVAALLAIGSVAAVARPEQNSFLEKAAPSYEMLMAQVKNNPVVTDRYMRHFSMSRTELISYFSTLRYSTLSSEGIYVVYNVPDSGVLRSRIFKLRPGTKVWVDLANKPILKVSCGNPLTRGPKRVDNEVTLYDNEQSAKPTTSIGEEVISADKPFEPIVPDVDIVPIATEPIPTAPNVPMIKNGKGLPGFLLLLPPLLLLCPPRHCTPPPVPEPASMIALGTGVLALIVRRRRRS